MKFKAITENHLYQKAYAKGSRWAARTCAVYILRDYKAQALAKANPAKTKINRVGISITKKIGGAVVRNRAKRIIREALREIDKKRGLKKGFLLVIAARPDIVGKKTADVRGDLLYSFKKTDMLIK
jgi:ribonuclease P protein component